MTNEEIKYRKNFSKILIKAYQEAKNDPASPIRSVCELAWDADMSKDGVQAYMNATRTAGAYSLFCIKCVLPKIDLNEVIKHDLSND